MRSSRLNRCTENEQTPVPGAGAEESSTYLLHEPQLIQRGSKHCLVDHKSCARRTNFLPTQLIDVGTTAGPKLSLVPSAEIESDNRLYLALSHCWGLTVPDTGKTTSGTLERHIVSISVGDLPRTFQVFIENARRLEIRYVWIDSLCIVQDDDDYSRRGSA
jgi:hypothetical protein